MHYRGNASGSTLRLSLGCLLRDDLGIHLRRVGGSVRWTFGEGEKVLSKWMAENAFVTWVIVEQPWALENEIIKAINLPLNLQGNESHQFYPVLRAIRKESKE